MTFVKQFVNEEAGQDLIEYSMLLGFCALFAVGMYQTINTSIDDVWGAANSALSAAVPAP